MKILITALAALLLFIFIACNTKNSGRQSNKEITTLKRKQDPQTKRLDSQSKPVPEKEESKSQSAVIVADEAVQEPPPSQKDLNNGLIDNKEFNTEDYGNIIENKFLAANQNPLSTFSIDVDEASYSNVRRYLQNGSIPPAGAVRIEEMINYFDYNYPQPQNGDPFTVNTEISGCPWNPQHKLVHIGLQGKEIPADNLPATSMVFLIDISGSMDEPNKLPLVQASLKMLVDQLREQDKVAIVVYAGNAGLVLPSTSGFNKQKIKEAIDNLEAGGSTAGGEGIKLAYKIAVDNFIKGGNNRILLATDGDFNVGVSSDDELVRLIEGERKSGVFLSVLGYGMGNYKDNKMQAISRQRQRQSFLY